MPNLPILARTCISLLALALLVTACGPLLLPGLATPTATHVPGPSADEYASEANIFLSGLADQGLFSGAVLVARDGEILFSKGYGFADRDRGTPNTPQTRFRIPAIQSQFTAMAILMLQAEGKLDVDDSICEYLQYCATAWEPITIHHLLSRTSGLPGYLPILWYRRRLATPLPPEEVVSVFHDEPLRHAPGDELDFWFYGSENFLLAQIVEQASGVPYDEFLHEKIFAPLGMENTGPVDDEDDVALGYMGSASYPAPTMDKSVMHGVGSHYSTVDDVLRWDQALYSEQPDLKALLDQMFTRQGDFTGEGAETAEQSARSGAAYSWNIGEKFGRRDLTFWSRWPGFLDYIDRYPDDRVAIILLSNQSDVDSTIAGTKLAKILFGAE